MEFRLLGPLEVRENGRAIELGAAKQRALLAVLLLNANRVVSTDTLIESLWGERAPETAVKALQVYVSQLRKAVGRDRIVTRSPGYELRGRGRRARPRSLRAPRPRRGFGEALAAVAWEPARRLRLRAVRAVGDRANRRAGTGMPGEAIDATWSAGRHPGLVGELEALVRAHPLRERLRAQLMLALYRSGRQADALDAYQAGRALLSRRTRARAGR